MESRKLLLMSLVFLFLSLIFTFGCGGGGGGGSSPGPATISALGFDEKITVEWSAVTGADSYNLYWSENPGVTKTTGTKITGVTSPYEHIGLTNGNTYYYIVTAVNDDESAASDEASAIPAKVLGPGLDYETIQAFIDAGAGAGPALRIAKATHEEGGQILVHRSVCIFSVGEVKAVISPAANLVQTNNQSGAWFLNNAGVTLCLNNLVLDGNGKNMYQGVRNHGTANITNVDFRNIKTAVSPYYGVAVLNFGGTIPGGAGSDSHSSGGSASNLFVSGCTFQNIGRIGVLTKGTQATTDVLGSTYTGKTVGDLNWLDYAFEVGAGGTGTFSGNTISQNYGVATSDGSTSAAILVTDYYGTGSGATITGNQIFNNYVGIAAGYGASDNSVVAAQYNKFSGNNWAISSTNPQVSAENNWWGNSSGPTHASNPGGTGDQVSDNVDFDPWCTSEAGCNP